MCSDCGRPLKSSSQKLINNCILGNCSSMIKLSLRQVDCYSFIGKLLTWVFLLQFYCVLLVMSHWNILECFITTGGVDWLLSISVSDTDSSEDRETVWTSIDKLSCWEEVWLQSSNITVSFSSSGIRSVLRKVCIPVSLRAQLCIMDVSK